MIRSLPLLLVLAFLPVACQVKEPVAEPTEEAAPSQPPVKVAPPPVVPNDPAELPAAPPPKEAAEVPVAEKGAEKAAEKDPAAPGNPADEARTEAHRKELLKQLEAPGAGDRFKAAIELGKTGNADCVGPLATTLKEDKDYFVRRAAARSLGELGFEEAVPALIEAADDEEEFVAISSKKALRAITGQQFETAAEWTAWWAKKKK